MKNPPSVGKRSQDGDHHVGQHTASYYVIKVEISVYVKGVTFSHFFIERGPRLCYNQKESNGSLFDV